MARKILNLLDSPRFRLLLGPAGIAGRSTERSRGGVCKRRGDSKIDIVIQIISDYLPKDHAIR